MIMVVAGALLEFSLKAFGLAAAALAGGFLVRLFRE